MAKERSLGKRQRENLLRATKHILKESEWTCLCQGCIELRAHWLTLLSGFDVHPLQMDRKRDGDDAIEIMEALLREFANEIEIDEFVNGSVHPSQVLILFHGPTTADRGRLYELPAEMSERLKAHRVQ